MSDLSRVQMVQTVTAAGGEACGVQAGAIDGARIVILEFETLKLGRKLVPFGFTLDEARKLRAWLTNVIEKETSKGQS